MKILFTFFTLLLAVWGTPLQTNSDVSNLIWEDQFEKKISITNNTKKLIIVFSKDKGNELKDFFESNPTFLEQNQALYLADVSGAPSFVTSMFMIPKFKKYTYSMGLITDEKMAQLFPKQEEKITIINLQNKKIDSIEFRSNLQ